LFTLVTTYYAYDRITLAEALQEAENETAQARMERIALEAKTKNMDAYLASVSPEDLRIIRTQWRERK
jgi:cell division protein FtsB